MEPTSPGPAGPGSPQGWKDERAIRIFVSSTFQDLRAERDELALRVFPALRARCEELGIAFHEVDLRWGTQERGHGVLETCLADVADCRPFFLGILGRRYGSVPEAIPEDLLAREPWLREAGGVSLTELEIRHGVLNDPARTPHAFFYLREESDPASAPGAPEPLAHAARLADLKQRILSSGLAVRTGFRDPRALGEQVRADLEALLARLFPEKTAPTATEREIQAHESLARARARAYVERRGASALLEGWASSGAPVAVLTGEAGAGKSSLISAWALDRRRPRADALPAPVVLLHLAEASPTSRDWVAALRHLMAAGDRALGIPGAPPTDASPGAVRAAFTAWLERAAQAARPRPLLLLIDGIDQLDARAGGTEAAWLPAEVPSGVRILLSARSGPALDALRRRGIPVRELGPLEPDERHEVVRSHLAAYGKALPPPDAERLARAPLAGNPLFLRTLLEELRLHGAREIAERLAAYLAAPTIEELFVVVLERCERDYGGERPGLVRDALAFLQAARQGLSEHELLGLLGTDGQPLEASLLAPLRHGLGMHLSRRAGLLSLSHDLLRRAVARRYLADAASLRARHEALGRWFAAHGSGDRQLEEEPWQWARAGAWDRLHARLADPAFLPRAIARDPFDVQERWAEVEAASAYRMASTYRALPVTTEAEATLAWAAGRLLGDAGHHEQAAGLWARVAAFEHGLGREDLATSARGNAAVALIQLRRLDEAQALLTEVEASCRRRRDRPGLQRCLGNLGLVRAARGNHVGAYNTHREEERLAQDLGDHDGLQASLGNQALALLASGQTQAALALFGRQEALCREHGNLQGLVAALGNQALAASAADDLDRAVALHAEEEALCRRLGLHGARRVSLSNLGECHRRAQDYEQALVCYRGAHDAGATVGDAAGALSARALEGRLLASLGRLDEAERLYVAMEREANAQGLGEGLLDALGGRGDVALRRGDAARALALHETQERLADMARSDAGRQKALAGQAGALLTLGRAPAAFDVLTREEALCRALSLRDPLAICLLRRALVLARDLERPREALPIADEARRVAQTAGNAALAADAENFLAEARADPRLRPLALHPVPPQQPPASTEDEPYLTAAPLPRQRMFLLQLQPANFAAVEAHLRTRDSVQVGGGEGPAMETHTITRADLAWARPLQALLDQADQAGLAGEYAQAIRHYLEVLGRAPGADFILMSVGSCWAGLEDYPRAIRWYERAAQVSPDNPRIRANLQAARAQARGAGG